MWCGLADPLTVAPASRKLIQTAEEESVGKSQLALYGSVAERERGAANFPRGA